MKAEKEVKPDWIAVKDALPEEGIPVETKIHDPPGEAWCLIRRVHMKGKWHDEKNEWSERPPTHWHQNPGYMINTIPNGSKIISERVFNLDHSWFYQRVDAIGDRRFRTDIKRNTYDNQSHARVDLWNGKAWENVVSKPISLCDCQKISDVQLGVTPKDFMTDHAMLMHEAMEVVGV